MTHCVSQETTALLYLNAESVCSSTYLTVDLFISIVDSQFIDIADSHTRSNTIFKLSQQGTAEIARLWTENIIAIHNIHYVYRKVSISQHKQGL